MEKPAAIGKKGTGFFGPVADRDDDIHLLVNKLGDILRPPSGDIDADLPHRSNGQRMDGGGLSAGAEGFVSVSKEGPQQTFRHLGTGGIPCA